MTKKLLASLIFVALLTAPAWAVPKEIIALQQQVALLMAQMQDLQKSVTANSAVLKTLVGQNADAISAVQTALKSLQQTVSAQAANTGQNQNQISQEFQNLSDAIGDLQARVNKITEIVGQIQQAQQTLPAPQTAPANATGTAPASPGAAAPSSSAPPAAANTPPVLPPDQLYQNALSDYVHGSYPLAASEFQQFITAYPNDGHIGEATYYLGDIFMKEQKYSDAIKTFDSVLNRFPDNGKIAPGAQLKKGFSLIALKERAAGIREFRSLIDHYPRSQEAQQAHDELAALGVRVRTE